ncbi:hypothetical protein ACHAWF_003511 [Thalassiosira exigua]
MAEEDDAAAVAGGEGRGGGGDPKKMFFTTSDLVDRMNSALRDAGALGSQTAGEGGGVGGDGGGGGFELQRKLPDGSYRPADEREVAAADFQSKMKQAATAVEDMDPTEKLDWARKQRGEGNALFAAGRYKEAMDVYLTCLVAADGSSGGEGSAGNDGEGTANDPADDDDDEDATETETEIKLPVLLNLALAAIKLGMPSKALKFCDVAIDETRAGKRSAKARFRRGKVRTLLGEYDAAESDLDRALELCGGGEDEDEGGGRAAILREKRKLIRLRRRARRDEREQRKALERFFRSDDRDGAADGAAEAASGLYADKEGGRSRTSPARRAGDDAEEARRPSCFRWYLHMVGRCAQKLLDVIGDGEDEDDDAPVDPDPWKSWMDDKKHA